MSQSFELVIPALNEEKIIEESIQKTYQFLSANFNNDRWLLTLAENNSDDDTYKIGTRLLSYLPNFQVIKVPQRGKGNAVYSAWSISKYETLAYMDADLAVDLSSLPELINQTSINYPLSAGSRFHKKSVTKRSLIREISSRGYNKIAQAYLKIPILDCQCGFKAINKQVFLSLTSLLHERGWFFDTELIYHAHRKGFKINEIPVKWVEGEKSNIVLHKDIPRALKTFKRIKRTV